MTSPGLGTSGTRIVLPAGTRVLVTGASGFIGSHLRDRLLSDGVEVFAVSRRPAGADHGRLTQLTADLSDPRQADAIIERARPDVVFHLAGVAAAARDVRLVEPTFDSNLHSTVNLLTAAHRAGVSRIVLPGSLEEPTEASAIASSPYAMSKWAASQYGRMFHALYDLPVSIARIFITYGPTSRDLHKLVPHVVLSLLANEAPRLGSGTRDVDWIHVDDVVEGLLQLATAPAAVGATIDLGSGELVSIRSVVERLAVLVGSHVTPQFGALPERPQEQVRSADVAATLARVGWRPRVDLETGLAATVEWFRRHREQLAAR